MKSVHHVKNSFYPSIGRVAFIVDTQNLSWLESFPVLFSSARARRFWEQKTGKSLAVSTPGEVIDQHGMDFARQFFWSALVGFSRTKPILEVCPTLSNYTDRKLYEGSAVLRRFMDLSSESKLHPLEGMTPHDIFLAPNTSRDSIEIAVQTIGELALRDYISTSVPAGSDTEPGTKTDHVEDTDEPESNSTNDPHDNGGTCSPEPSLPEWVRVVVELAELARKRRGANAPLFSLSSLSDLNNEETYLVDKILALRTEDILDVEYEQLPILPYLQKLNIEKKYYSGQRQLEIASRKLVKFRVFGNSADEREKYIFFNRMMRKHPDSLATIGDKFNVTRERVRQIESRLKEDFDTFLNDELFLSQYLNSFKTKLPALAPWKNVMINHPELISIITTTGFALIKLLELLNIISLEDGWMSSGPLEQYESESRLVANTHMDECGVIELETFRNGLSFQMEAEAVSEWIERLGWKLQDGYIMTSVSSAGKRAASILAIKGKPMTIDDLYDLAEETSSKRTFSNSLHSYDKIVKVSLHEFGLKSWGSDEYKGIKQQILSLLESNGNSIEFDKLSDILVTKYKVARTSVATYANIPPFILTQGRVVLRSQEAVRRATVTSTRDAFLVDDVFLYRTTVTHDHLRGSGSSVPAALAHLFDIKREIGSDPVVVWHEDQPVRIGWMGTNPNLGSIRKLLEAQNFIENQHVVLRINVKERTIAVTRDPMENATTLDNFFKLLGINSEFDALSKINQSIGIASKSPLYETIGSLQDRGDKELAELLSHNKHRLTHEDEGSSNESGKDVYSDLEDLLGDHI